MSRIECKQCGWSGKHEDLLIAANPFDAEDIVHGCPRCKQIEEGFDSLCDFAGCKDLAASGNPLKDGSYVWTCHKHYLQLKSEDKLKK